VVAVSLVLVPGKLLKPSLMFVGMAREYLSEALFRCFTLGQAPSFTHKY
jgi:hypothetical protein